MTSRDFAYWLQGFFEISRTTTILDTQQTQMIRNHLNLVFKHEIDPSIDGGDPVKQQTLNEIHNNLPTHLQPNTFPPSYDQPMIRC